MTARARAAYVDWEALAEEQRAELEDEERGATDWLDATWEDEAAASAAEAEAEARRHTAAEVAALLALLLPRTVRRVARVYVGIDTHLRRVVRQVRAAAPGLAVEQARQVLGDPRWAPSRTPHPAHAYADHARARTVAAVAVQAQERLRDVLVRQAAAPSLTPEAAREAVRRAVAGEGWRARRLVVTETAHAYNAAQAGAMGALANEPALRGLRLRWTELVDDVTGRPLDNRVGNDSLELHGQLAPPGGVFIMPPDVVRNVGRMMGRTWPHPPNRPHDRAVLTPWLPGLGQPGWVWTGGARARF